MTSIGTNPDALLGDTRAIVLADPGRPEVNFLGIHVHPMEAEAFHNTISEVIARDGKCLTAHHNLHSLYLWHMEMKANCHGPLHRYYERAHLTLMDGMSMVLLARLHGFAVQRKHRIAYNQTLPQLLGLAEKNGWRIFYLGSSESVAAAGGDALRRAFPNLVLETQHGYFSKVQGGAENQAMLARIASFRPHILFVGMGMPVQENWIEENFEAIKANVIVSSGATLDYFAGALPKPPDWMGQAGLEWAYRLANEPRRLAFRYLAEPWLILVSVLQSRAQQFGRSVRWGRMPQPPIRP